MNTLPPPTQRRVFSIRISVFSAGLAIGLRLCTATGALDSNGNGLDDIWELIYGASALTMAADTDGDGATNEQESLAGTDPFDPLVRPMLTLTLSSSSQFQLGYAGIAGKRYRIEAKTDLSQPEWTTEFLEVAPVAGAAAYQLTQPAGSKFWRLRIDDADSDADGLSDAEERWLGFAPSTNRTDRNDATDLSRVTAGLGAASTVTLAVLDPRMSERWPDPGALVLRRSGGLGPITVNLTFAGTATRGTDHTTSTVGDTVFIPTGGRGVPVLLNPIADAADGEPAESIIVTVQSGAGYTLGATTSGNVTLDNETPASLPAAKAAARFLIQAAFGPDQDSTGDADDLPENVEEVMAMGFSAWIDDQFPRRTHPALGGGDEVDGEAQSFAVPLPRRSADAEHRFADDLKLLRGERAAGEREVEPPQERIGIHREIPGGDILVDVRDGHGVAEFRVEVEAHGVARGARPVVVQIAERVLPEIIGAGHRRAGVPLSWPGQLRGGQLHSTSQHAAQSQARAGRSQLVVGMKRPIGNFYNAAGGTAPVGFMS